MSNKYQLTQMNW